MKGTALLALVLVCCASFSAPIEARLMENTQNKDFFGSSFKTSWSARTAYNRFVNSFKKATQPTLSPGEYCPIGTLVAASTSGTTASVTVQDQGHTALLTETVSCDNYANGNVFSVSDVVDNAIDCQGEGHDGKTRLADSFEKLMEFDKLMQEQSSIYLNSKLKTKREDYGSTLRRLKDSGSPGSAFKGIESFLNTKKAFRRVEMVHKYAMCLAARNHDAFFYLSMIHPEFELGTGGGNNFFGYETGNQDDEDASHVNSTKVISHQGGVQWSELIEHYFEKNSTESKAHARTLGMHGTFWSFLARDAALCMLAVSAQCPGGIGPATGAYGTAQTGDGISLEFYSDGGHQQTLVESTYLLLKYLSYMVYTPHNSDADDVANTEVASSAHMGSDVERGHTLETVLSNGCTAVHAHKLNATYAKNITSAQLRNSDKEYDLYTCLAAAKKDDDCKKVTSLVEIGVDPSTTRKFSPIFKIASCHCLMNNVTAEIVSVYEEKKMVVNCPTSVGEDSSKHLATKEEWKVTLNALSKVISHIRDYAYYGDDNATKDDHAEILEYAYHSLCSDNLNKKAPSIPEQPEKPDAKVTRLVNVGKADRSESRLSHPDDKMLQGTVCITNSSSSVGDMMSGNQQTAGKCNGDWICLGKSLLKRVGDTVRTVAAKVSESTKNMFSKYSSWWK